MELLIQKLSVNICPDCALIMVLTAFFINVEELTKRPVTELVRVAADSIDNAVAKSNEMKVGNHETHH